MTFIKKQINPNSTFEGKEDEDEDEFPLRLHPPNFFFYFPSNQTGSTENLKLKKMLRRKSL